MLGKVVGDLQSGVSVSGNVISGTLLYVTGYTGFSGVTAEQSGNYLALHCTAASGYTIKARTINGLNDNYVTLDDDGIIIVKVLDKDTQKLEFVATAADGSTETRQFVLTGLTLNEE